MNLDQQLSQKAHNFSVGFRQKVAITFTLLIIFIMLISVYLVTIQIKHTSLSRAEDSGKLLGRMIALSMGEDIVRGSFQGIDYALKEFVKLNKINYCLILDNYGRIISSTHPQIHGKYFTDAWSRSALFAADLTIRRAISGKQPVYDTAVPIVIGGKRYGMIRAGFTIDEEYSSIRELLLYNLSLGLVLIFIGVLIAYGISATLLSPLNSILSSIESISHGDYTQKAMVKTSDEFEELASSFNRLAGIMQNRESTSSFINKKILENDASLANKNFSGKPLNAVILHIELHKFNSFIDRNSPSEAVDTLNRFFNETTEIIAQANGIVDKLGDGFITALFPVSKNDAWPAHLRAGFAALSSRNNLNSFNFKQAQLGLEEIFMKSGLTAGKVIIGHIGPRIRSDFSAIGSCLAAARKASTMSNKKTLFMPVADKAFANPSRDFLTLSPLTGDADADDEDSDNDYYTLNGFANLAYFSERLKSTSSRGNLSIITAFGLTTATEGFEFLKRTIADTKCEYRNEAVKALSPFIFKQNEEVKEYLKGLIQSTSEAPLKSVAVSILGLSRDHDLASLYTGLFSDPDDRVRANAVEAYMPLDVPDKRDQLKKLLDDPKPRVCANALLGLWLADDQQTLACLYGLLKSDSTKMRASAAYAIYFLAASRKFRRLFPAYSEAPGFAIIPIVENIYKRLKAMLESQEASERYQALRALGKVGDADNRNLVIALLKDETEPDIINLGHQIITDWDKTVTNAPE